MGKILACCAICMALLAGWQHSQVKGQDPVLRAVPGPEINSIEEQLRVEYPKLFKRNTVISFGRKDCRWCPLQRSHLQALAARGYRVAYFDVTKHELLYEYMRGKSDDSVPLTVVFVDGKVKHTFLGLTYWRALAVKSKDCRRKDLYIDIKIRI